MSFTVYLFIVEDEANFTLLQVLVNCWLGHLDIDYGLSLETSLMFGF